MSDELQPYIDHCARCGDGLLRFSRCTSCDRIVARCDECELMWEDVAALSTDTNLSSDSLFPQCPACGYEDAEFARVTVEEMEDNQLEQFRAGDSV